MDTEIWDVFHDGTLINVQENASGNLLLTIKLEYVREEFDEDFKYFLLELHECSLFEYYPSVWDIEIIKDIKSILKYDLWMTDVEKKRRARKKNSVINDSRLKKGIQSLPDYIKILI